MSDGASRSVFYAHSREDCGPEGWERLEWHLRRTGALARRFTRAFGVPSWGAASGLLHDVGKYSDAFQRLIAGDALRVDHSTGGAREALALYGRDVGHILAYGIAGHHAGLPNGGEGAPSELTSRLESRKVPSGHERWRGQITVPPPATLMAEAKELLARDGPPDGRFAAAFFSRMVFSALVDADFLATEWFMDRAKGWARRQRRPGPGDLAAILRHYLAERFGNSPPNDINRQRAGILEACRTAAAEAPGVFSLAVPTGGGKTLSSLSFALEHAARHGLSRVIYAIPYTSIIEQSADEFRTALKAAGDDILVEHHSAAEPPPEHEEEPIGPQRLRLATENWDAPLVVTTTVQLFESLYAMRPSRCRKLHNMARSVIVLDEAQALPLPQLTPCLAALRELVVRYGASIVLCSATLPAFDGGVSTRVSLPRARPIVPQTRNLHAAFRRVAAERAGEVDDKTLAARLTESRQVLCIVNARRHAAELFSLLPDDGSRFHLSAAMCPAHRREVLAEVRHRLNGRLPCRLVATRVIEAGVDVSFPAVWRSIAGVDSLAQAAGRCNRHGELAGLGRFVVFEPARGDAIPAPLKDLRMRAKEATMVLEHHHPDPLAPATVEAYFRRLFAIDPSPAKRSHDATGAWEMLNASEGVEHIPFRSVAMAFRMIDDDTQPLIIPFNDRANDLIGRLEGALRQSGSGPRRLPLDVVRGLQGFTVGCYGLQRLRESGDVRPLDPERRFHVLCSHDLYDKATGLSLDRAGLRDPKANLL